MQKLKAVGDRYKIQKKLFKVNSYIYARIFDKFTLDTSIGCVYIYENEEPGQTLKMITQKFTIGLKLVNLIFPSFHIKDNINDKNISIFFMQHKIVPLDLFKQQQYNKIDINQMLKFTYDSLCSLHHLHSHDIIHGNISLLTCYISKENNKQNVDFALNILDTSIFHQQLLKIYQSLLFKSESQHNSLKISFKDDAQSLIYVLVHLISRGRLFTENRYNAEWINQNQLLRWKTMDFFKQMIEILPQQLQFISQIYIDIKTLSKYQKPDYPKYIKRAYTKMKQAQQYYKKKQLKSTDSLQLDQKQSNHQNAQYKIQKKVQENNHIKKQFQILQQNNNITRKSKKKVSFNEQNPKQLNKKPSEISGFIQQKKLSLSKQQIIKKQKQRLEKDNMKISKNININRNEIQQQQIFLIMDPDQASINQKFNKLQSTKFTFKNKSLLDNDSVI